MKIILQILIITLSISTFGNEIDSLKTTENVVEFLKKVNPELTNEKYSKFLIKPTDSIAEASKCSEIFKQWEIKNWEKSDLNNDRKTDLIFIYSKHNNYQTYAMIDKGNQEYQFFWLSQNPFDYCELFKPIKFDGQNVLKIYSKREKITDTLVFKHNAIVEFNKTRANYNIKSLAFDATRVYGAFPKFTIKLYNDGKSEFLGMRHVEYLGKAEKQLSKSVFNDFAEMLEYMNVKKLKNNYAVNWTDSITVILTIEFEDGSTKTIKDYGMHGTYGLNSIYNKIIEIGTKTEWK